MKLLNQIIKKQDYYKYVDFYSVNADIEENYEWLNTIYQEEELEALAVPTWVFYSGIKGDGDDIYCSGLGNMSQEQMREEIEDLIDWFDRTISIQKRNNIK